MTVVGCSDVGAGEVEDWGVAFSGDLCVGNAAYNTEISIEKIGDQQDRESAGNCGIRCQCSRVAWGNVAFCMWNSVYVKRFLRCFKTIF
jgi:hypothetical protein